MCSSDLLKTLIIVRALTHYRRLTIYSCKLTGYNSSIITLHLVSYSVLKGLNREDRIRTCDPLVPNQVLYQAELLPDKNAPYRSHDKAGRTGEHCFYEKTDVSMYTLTEEEIDSYL